MPTSTKPQIFLCHASEDKDAVQQVYLELKARGYVPWLDKESLLPGQIWSEEIPRAIRASDFVLVFLSAISTAKRGYVQKEFKIALDVLDEIPEGRTYVIPVKLNECDVPSRFSHLHWAELYDTDGLEKVLHAIDMQWERTRSTQSALAAAATPLQELVAATQERVSELEKKLLQVSAETTGKYAHLLSRADAGVVKLLCARRYSKAIPLLYGGSWFSFSDARHDRHNEADICLAEDGAGAMTLRTGLTGMDYGFFFDLGNYPFAHLLEALSAERLSAAEHETWRFMCEYKPPSTCTEVRLEAFKFGHGMHVAGVELTEDVPAKPQNTYLLRSVNDRISDLLVAIRVEQVQPGDSIELAWAIVRTFPIPQATGPEPYPHWERLGNALLEQLQIPSPTATADEVRLTSSQAEALKDYYFHRRYQHRTPESASDLLALQAAGLLVFWPPSRTVDQVLGSPRLTILRTTPGRTMSGVEDSDS